MVLTLFRETRPPETKRLSVASAFSGYGLVLRDRRMLAFCLIALLPLFGFGQIWVTMPIMLGELHGVSAQQWAPAHGRVRGLHGDAAVPRDQGSSASTTTCG